MPKGIGTTGTGEVVRDFLLHGPATITECHQEVKKACQESGWHWPRADNFRTFFWKLRKAGLVEEDHREPLEEYGGQLSGTRRSSDFHKERIYYRIAKGQANSPLWKNVQGGLYGS